MLTRNVFCSLYYPFHCEDDSEKIARAREMQSIQREQVEYQMALYKYYSVVEQNNKEDYRAMVEYQAFVAGCKLYDELDTIPRPAPRKYHKYHCQNADPRAQFRLAYTRPHARMSQKLLGEQATKALSQLRAKYYIHQTVLPGYEVRPGMPESERRRMERDRYMLADEYYVQSLEYRQAYPERVFSVYYKHDYIPVRQRIYHNEQYQQKQVSHREEVEHEQQIAVEFDESRYKLLVYQALDILDARK